MNTIDLTQINTLTYAQYRETVTALAAQGKVTGDVQDEDLLNYTRLNETRMNRLQKTLALDPEVALALNGLKDQYTWLVLSEGWCGDAAQLMPIFNLMASASPAIELKVALRDQHPALMDQFLTNGARSIPKLIVLDAGQNVLASWGPRPMGAAQLIIDYKATHGVIDEQAKTDLQMWYLHDKGLSTQRELAALMQGLEVR